MAWVVEGAVWSVVAYGAKPWARVQENALRLALMACCTVLASALAWALVTAKEAGSNGGGYRVGNTVTLGCLLAVLAAELVVAVHVSIRRARKRLGRVAGGDARARCRPRFRRLPPDPATFDERMMRALAAARGEWRGWEAAELEEERRQAARRALRVRRRAADHRVVRAVRETERRWLRDARRSGCKRAAEVWETHCHHRGSGTVIGITRTCVVDREGSWERCPSDSWLSKPAGLPDAISDLKCDSAISAFENRSHAGGADIASGVAACLSGGAEPAGSQQRGKEVACLLGAMSVHQQGWSSENDPGAWLVG